MKRFAILILLPFILLSCNKQDSIQPAQSGFNDQSDQIMMGAKSKIHLDFSNLSPLGPHFRYEGWIIVEGNPISTGKFNITPGGVMAPSVFNVNKEDLEMATAFVLTIEPHPDPEKAPASTHVLAGDFVEGTASLTIAHPAALGTDFSTSDGTLILATPTTSTTEDELSGIWFLDLSSGSPMVGLDLPELPEGWIYEGWAVIDGIPVTSGKFMDVDDYDFADPYSSQMNPGPPFPGEDYVMNAPDGLSFPTDLSGGVGVISVEPYPDNGDEPFAIKPLVGEIPGNATDHFNYSMMQNPGSFPTGTASK
jgi:hypothetical protein